MSDIIAKGTDSPPSLDELLDKAKKVERCREPTYVGLEYYGPVMHELREKGLTWTEISAWFRANGLTYTPAHFSMKYKQWIYMESEKKAREEDHA